MNYNVWMGKPNYFKEEVNALLSILHERIITDRASLLLSSEYIDGFDWICDALKSVESEIQPGTIALQTSGTTGVPKTYLKSVKIILSQKKGAGSNSDKWLLTYSPTRWAGMSVIFHTIKSGAELIVPNDLSPSAILSKMPEATHVSMTPSLFRKLMILGCPELAKAHLRQITFGGEYATQKVLDDAKKLWPNAKITHIYAMTELGDICACSDGQEGMPISKLRTRFDLNKAGELILDGFNTGDIWELKNERLYFIGRSSETINVGGAKVTASVVENAALTIPDVAECKAYAVPNSLLGQVICLDYVGNADSKEIRKCIAAILPKYAIPVKFNKVNTIALTSAGKKERK